MKSIRPKYMLIKVTHSESTIIESILNSSLYNVGVALTSLSGLEVKVQPVSLHTSETSHMSGLSVVNEQKSQVNLLYSNFRGPFSGSGYMLLSEAAKHQLLSKWKPLWRNHGRGKSRISEDLKEVNHIVSAGYLARFSSYLKEKPVIQDAGQVNISGKEAISFMFNSNCADTDSSTAYISAHAHFYSEEYQDLNFMFVWKFDEAFVNTVKSLCSFNVEEPAFA